MQLEVRAEVVSTLGFFYQAKQLIVVTFRRDGTFKSR